ncbi:copper transporter [Nonomuraea sp. NPDC050783]|uniref:copper transporter n=1 Tax=Nonomuraea sp. NPDC050783 TaxID=3154634 RepID=UPI00346700D3
MLIGFLGLIDFRYHIASIVSIFLALAVGIVLGTSLLQEPALKTAQDLTAQLATTKEELRTQINALERLQAENDAFIASITPERVAEVLAGERVLLVEAPDANPAEREAIQETLLQAGADYAGQVTLADAYLDQQRLDKLDMLVNKLMPADMTIDPAATTYEKGAMLLSATLLTSDPAQAGTRNKETLTVLDEFERAGLLSIDREPGKRATIAVMIAPENPFEGENAEAQASALVSLAARLDEASRGTVLAGGNTSTIPGGLIAALRDKNETVKHVTTVDTADTPLGRITVVYALREQLSGRAGQYGTGTGASSFLLPTSLSTPSPRR